ncbi:Translational activator gcn1, partial [Fasciolopsis buskii]
VTGFVNSANFSSQVYALITGPEGKKSGQDVRLAGLTCLGELSAHGGLRTTAIDKVGAACVGLLLDYMEQESHEETLIYAARQLVKWLRRFKFNLPDRFYNFVKVSASYL